MTFAVGTKLGPYEILSPLGAGGMGEVYRAKDTKLHREVAIKVLPAGVVSNPERLQRFEREATTVAALNHPNIVTIFGIEESDGHRFIAMELVEGETLDRMIAPGGMAIAKIFDIVIPMADALAAAPSYVRVSAPAPGRPASGTRFFRRVWPIACYEGV